MSDNCLTAIQKIFSELRKNDEFVSVSDKDLESIAQRLDDIKHLAEKDGVDFRERAMKELDGIEREFVNREIRKKTQALREKELRGYIFSEEGKEGKKLVSVLAGDASAEFKSGRSVDLTQKTRTRQAKSAFESDINSLERPSRIALKSGKMDREASIAVGVLRRGDAEALKGIDPLAVKFAKAIIRTQDFLKSEIERSLGHAIGTIDDYLVKRTHDAFKIEAAGFKQWSKDILAAMDLDETFGVRATDTDFITKELQDDYNKFTKGTTQDSTKGRTYKFKNLELEYKYNQRYGQNNLYESIHAAIDDTMRQTSLMDVFGPDHERGFNSVKKMIVDMEDKNAEAVQRGVKGAKRDYVFWKNSSEAQAIYNNLTGKTYPGGATYALANDIKGTGNLVFLPNAGIRAVFQNVLPAAMYARTITGDHPFTAMMKVLAATKEFTENRKLSLKAGQMLQDMTADMNFELQAGANKPGMIAGKIVQMAEYAEAKGPEWMQDFARRTKNTTSQKGAIAGLNSAFFKVTGLEDVNKAYAGGIGRLIMSDFADVANKGFDELPSHTRATFDRYGITEKHWNVMQLAIDETPSGMQIMSAERIAAMPDQLIADVTGITKTKGISAFRREVADAYGSIINDATNYATTTPNAKTQAWTNFGIPTDNPIAAVAALVMQFKSFGIYQTQMIRALRNVEMAAAGREGATGLARQYAGGKAVGAYMTGSAALWYLSQQMITMGQGKSVESNLVGTPGIPDELARSIENPIAPEILSKSFIKSGSLGVGGDLLDAGLDRGRGRNIFNYMAGPAMATAVNAAEIGVGLAKGENKAKKAAAFAKTMIPFNNFAVTGRLMTPLITTPMMELISPEYVLQQQQRDMLRDSGISNAR